MPEVEIVPARSDHDVERFRALLLEYAGSLDVDLGFQGFDQELAGLPGDYAPPHGCWWLAIAGDDTAACVAVRRLDHETAELKRLYVRPAYRGRQLGDRLTHAAVAFARAARYRRLRLDTLPLMTTAQAMYRRLGFREIPPYRASAVPGTVFMELELSPPDA